ncbi:hypothetical protein TRIP_B200670 [uncultured Desulfatiglans sp.]|uniref:Uncharacterized protein n=1 Tax=Uncultured Desulfatiglans sp. TaxID=1748965 RepID=A0A653A3D1_UNCDX|nr:hypothetical protein TRIP_B200670 [uncultured Desulfatiglans sp.]
MGDDARLETRRASGLDDHPIGWNLQGTELLQNLPAGMVLAHHPAQDRPGPERSHIVHDIGSAAQQPRLLAHLDNRHGGLGRYPGHLAPDVLIHDDVAHDEDPGLLESIHGILEHLFEVAPAQGLEDVFQHGFLLLNLFVSDPGRGFLADLGVHLHLCLPSDRQVIPAQTTVDFPYFNSFHPEMVFLANLGVHLHVCLCGDPQVASAQRLDFPDIGQTGTRREAVGLSTRRP